jgi:lipopolysaccharide/colanic/teichoic acid biosynthesis glycosyltransferase
MSACVGLNKYVGLVLLKGEAWMATSSSLVREEIQLKQRYLRAKRALDVLFTLLLLPFLCLLMLIVALLIRLDSEGPVFYRQKRVGQDGVEFDMLKFRSMHVNNDDTIHREAVRRYMNGDMLNGDSGAESTLFKLVDDPRVTRVGRFIRKFSVDEFPQIFNVLRGEMSLVGPRPPLPYEVEEYSLRDSLRLHGKPGITGYWQVYGRSRVTFDEMVEMDINYLRQQSILQDIKLIILTVPVAALGRGGA